LVIRKSLFGALLALMLIGPAPAGAADDRLPNLRQEAPRDIHVEGRLVDGQRRFRLGFDSAAGNVGTGPLTIHGFRKASAPEMSVDQLITQSDGSSRVVRGVGVMSYVVHPDHHHWHFLGFERYELRRVGPVPGRVRSDRKTGFCLGDRYKLPGARRLTFFSPFPEQADQCGLGQPGLRGLFAGISVGWGDRYSAYLEGQFIDITRLPPGRYRLVHTANPDHRLVESDYGDNSGSVLLRLSWPHGWQTKPAVTVLATCEETPTCA
jgi:hypothetical protein